MANYASLKAAIQQVVKTNGNNEITGALLQQSLLSMINSLGANYQFAGIATPSTNPGTPDQNVFYLASVAGTYSNFGSIVLQNGEVAILTYNGTWTKNASGFASQEKQDEIEKRIDSKFQSVQMVGRGNTYTSRLCYDFIAGHKYKLYVKSWDGSNITPSGYVFLVTTVTPSGSTEIIAVTQYSQLANEYVIDIPDNINYVAIGGRVATDSMGIIIVEDITAETLLNEKVDSRLISVARVPGNGNTAIASIQLTDVIPGHKYRVYVKNWDLSGVTSTSDYDAFAVRSIDANGNRTYLVHIYMGSIVEPYYDIVAPSDCVAIQITGRATLNTIGICFLYDITDIDGFDTVKDVNKKLDAALQGVNVAYDEGVILTSTGGAAAEYRACVSPFIPISTNDVITTHPGYNSNPGYNIYIVGYNSQKQFVSGQYWALGNYLPERNITVTNANVAFVRMVFNRNATNAFVKVNGITQWEYNKAKIGVFNYNISALGLTKPIYGNNEYVDWMAGYVRDSDGGVTNSSVNSCTGFIDVSEYNQIEVVMNVTIAATNASVCFYNESGVFIRAYTPNYGASEAGYETRILDIPTGAKFVRCSFYDRFREHWYLNGRKKSTIQLGSALSKQQRITLEFGNLDANGQIKPYASDFLNYARTSLYYKIASINLPYTYRIFVYDSAYLLIDTIEAQPNTDYALDINNWHKIVIGYTENTLSKKEIVISLNVFDKSYNVITPKTITTAQYLVKYKKGRGLYVDGDSDYSEIYDFPNNLISNTLRLFLPPNYSPTGEPVKLLYKAHGSNGYSWIDSTDWGGETTSLDFLADNGFALFDMFAGTSYYSAIINPNLTHEWATRIANYNVPIQLAAQIAAYEWVVRNFNVDPRIYVFGKSHGGMAGIYATNKMVPTRAVALFAPLITPIADMYQPWGNNADECSMCLDDMCFIPPTGMTFEQMVTAVNTKASGWKDILLANIRQQSGLNAFINGIANVKQSDALTALMNDNYRVIGGMDNVIRHTDTPVKIWSTPDDEETVFANGWNFIASLQNGGSNAQFREFPTGTGGHYFDSFTNELSIKDTVITSLGVQYVAPRAYIEAVNFFNQF